MLTVQRLPEAREGLGGRLSHYTLYKPVLVQRMGSTSLRLNRMVVQNNCPNCFEAVGTTVLRSATGESAA